MSRFLPFRIWSFVVLVAFVSFLCVPLVPAQGTPTVDVKIQDLPVRPVEKAGGSHLQEFNVALTLSNLVCPTAQTFPVNLSAILLTDENVSYNHTFVPSATVGFAVPAQQFLAQPYSQVLPVALQVEGNALPVGAHRVLEQVTARYAGTNQGCQGAAVLPERSHSASFELILDVGVPGGLPPPGPAMPFPPVGWFLVALLGWLGFTRRGAGGSI